MSLHVLRLFTITAACCWFVSGIHAQNTTTNLAEADTPWSEPSDQADSAVADWAKQTLKSSSVADSPDPKPDGQQSPAELSPPTDASATDPKQQSNERYITAPAPLNASLAQPSTTSEVGRSIAPSQISFAAQEPPIRYEPNDPPVSVNPLRSGTSQANTIREPAPLSAAERAFANTQQADVPSLPPANYQSNHAAQAAFSEPAPTQATNEPSAFSPTLESNARPIAPVQPARSEQTQIGALEGERSLLASRQSMSAQPTWNNDNGSNVSSASNTGRATFSEPRSSQADAVSMRPSGLGTGQPGDVRLEGPQSPALKIEKRGPAEARVGQPCRFVVTVRNTGNQTAESVVLRDEIPAGARLIETVPTASQEAGQIVWQLGALAPGEQRSVELRVSPERQGPLGSVATVTFNASASAKTICTKPELAVRLSAPAKVLVGHKQPLKVEVHNPGTGAATNVVLVEEVPQSMRHEAGPSLEFEVGTLAPGETRQLDLLLTAEQAGSVVNRLTASADGNLRVEQTVAFDVVAPSLALAVEGPKRRYLERPASYTVNIDNPGSAPAKDVRIVTQLPSGMKFVNANNLGEYDAETHSVYWSLAELPEGERGAVKLTALPVTAGEHTLRVNGEASNGLKTSESQNILVEGIVALAFDVRDRQDPIEIGSDAVYDVVVTNEGTKAATGVRVTVDAPASMQVVDAQGKVEHRVAEGRVEFAPIPTLRPGEKFPYRIRLRGTQAGDQRISVAVESDDLQQPIRREESTRVFGDE